MTGRMPIAFTNECAARAMVMQNLLSQYLVTVEALG